MTYETLTAIGAPRMAFVLVANAHLFTNRLFAGKGGATASKQELVVATGDRAVAIGFLRAAKFDTAKHFLDRSREALQLNVLSWDDYSLERAFDSPLLNGEITVLLMTHGDVAEARRNIELELDLLRRLATGRSTQSAWWIKLAARQITSGSFMLTLEDNDKARSLALTAYRILRQLPASLAEQTREPLAESLKIAGTAALRKGDLSDARRYLEEAFHARREHTQQGETGRRTAKALVELLTLISLTNLQEGKPDSALTTLTIAIELAGGLPSDASDSAASAIEDQLYETMGDTLLSLNRLQEAHRYYVAVLERWQMSPERPAAGSERAAQRSRLINKLIVLYSATGMSRFAERLRPLVGAKD
jgi:tetratricopeptide (TPR) repeat protein